MVDGGNKYNGQLRFEQFSAFVLFSKEQTSGQYWHSQLNLLIESCYVLIKIVSTVSKSDEVFSSPVLISLKFMNKKKQKVRMEMNLGSKRQTNFSDNLYYMC